MEYFEPFVSYINECDFLICFGGDSPDLSEASNIDGLLTIFTNSDMIPVAIGISHVTKLSSSSSYLENNTDYGKHSRLLRLLEAAKFSEGVNTPRSPYTRAEAYEVAGELIRQMGKNQDLSDEFYVVTP